ncbi:hypothetical protein SAMN05443549_10676 [Flavobacterium fluvii]|uniref:Uncharacterized protein n=1 Tax=Flavobacterium fluvii TaxID=468056 RepID=A0A1M5M8I6_9FLAO|nr:hypothetical protein [Flavobacterium fluvii]SHG73562.1 hypothetical protein SAMN05443549_10676 [Flavobacterium fluvii]
MNKTNPFYSFLFLLSVIGLSNAQASKPEFQKTVDSINAIIKASPQAYYMDTKHYNEFITKISVTKQGIVSFTDSVPKPEISSTKSTKKELISDCCPQPNSRKLDLFEVKKWNLVFPYVYLKNKDDETFAKFLGFQKPNLSALKKQFEKLATLCKKEK